MEIVNGSDMNEGLREALAKAQGELKPVPRNETGQAGPRKYKYATLDEVLKHSLPVLTKHGLSISQQVHTTWDPQGNANCTLVTLLMHKDGGHIESEVPVGDRYIFKGRCDPYARLQVFVNGKRWQDVDLDEAGGFSIMVPVEHEGWNTVTFEAQDTYGTKNSIDRRVYWSGF